MTPDEEQWKRELRQGSRRSRQELEEEWKRAEALLAAEAKRRSFFRYSSAEGQLHKSRAILKKTLRDDIEGVSFSDEMRELLADDVAQVWAVLAEIERKLQS
jgi:hypothetical protein